MRSGEGATVAKFNLLGNVFHDVDGAILFLEGESGLLVVAIDDGFPDFDGAAVRLRVAGDDVEESGFPDTVFPDDADFLASYEFVREVVQYTLIAVVLGNVMEFQDLFPQALALDV